MINKYPSFIQILTAITTLTLALLSQHVFAHGTNDEQFISPAELASSLDLYQIIDVRDEVDYTAAHVPTAHSLPLAEISKARLASLGITSSHNIIVYGNSEAAPTKAKPLFALLGYTNLRLLAGGFVHWQEDKQPVERGGPQLVDTLASVKTTSLLVEPETYDFGTIRGQDGTVSTTFIIRNTGEERVTIQEITTSCGCTSATISQSMIDAGETAALKVNFNPNFHKEPEGTFSRTVFLQSSEGVEIQAKIQVAIDNQQLP